jgi:hypothetical protein
MLSGAQQHAGMLNRAKIMLNTAIKDVVGWHMVAGSALSCTARPGVYPTHGAPSCAGSTGGKG